MLNLLNSLWYRENNRVAVISLMLSCAIPMSVLAQPKNYWTLEQSVRRAIEIAPESRGAQAAVNAREGALEQAGAWPNPQIELRADDKMGKDDGSGGTDFTQLSVSQPLPLSGRLGHQQSSAGAKLDAARADQRYQQVQLETRVAQLYHGLQLAEERLRLSEQRLQLADDLQDIGRRRAEAGELSRLESLRMDLIRESAQQILDKAEGAHNEALSRFSSFLGLSREETSKLATLQPFGPIPVLKKLQISLSKHASLLAARHRFEAARSEIELARAGRLPDPVVRLFSERDVLNGRRQKVTGIGLGINIPFWDRKNGRIDEAQAQAIQIKSELDILERDLSSRLQQSYLHLKHLVAQGKHYRSKVFEPSQKVFDLTRKAYASGEVKILSLIDANNTYFDARERYLELLQEAWLEAAEVRLAAGRSLITSKLDTNNE